MRYARITDPFPGTIVRVSPHGRIRLTDEQVAWLCKWFPLVENIKLQQMSGLSHSALHRYARMLHLKKSEEGEKGIRHRATRKAMKTCKENGYYDSLKGRKPSQACLDAWKTVVMKPGYINPIQRIRMDDPKRYRMIMRRSGKNRSELIRKERLREIYGLPKKTKLHLPLTPYTRSQTTHRHNALKRGYLLNPDIKDMKDRFVIFYDSETERSEKFEKNLIKDGFTVVSDEPEQKEYCNG